MGGLAGVLTGVGQAVREQHLLDMQNQKEMQDRSLQFMQGAINSGMVDPQGMSDLLGLYMQTSQTPLGKFDPTKVSKGLQQIIGSYHDRSVQGPQGQAQSSVPIPGGTYNAGGFEQGTPLKGPGPTGQPSMTLGGLQPQAGGGFQAPPPPMQTPQPPPQMGNSIPLIPTPNDLEFMDPRRKAIQDANLKLMGVPAEMAMKRAEQQAEAERQQQVFGFEKQYQEDLINKRIEALKSEKDPATGKSVWEGLTPRQRADVRIGATNITPEMRSQIIPGTRSGSSAPPGTTDSDGNPVDPAGEYRIRMMPDGTPEWNRTIASVGTATMPSANSPTGWSLFKITRTGQKVGEVTGAAPPIGYAPVVVNGVRHEVVDFGDHKELIPVTSATRTEREIPGGIPTPTPPPAPAGGSAAPPKAAPLQGAPAKPRQTATASSAPKGSIPGAVVLGAKNLSPQQKMAVESGVVATDRAMQPLQRMLANLDVLDNPVVAKAIQLQADPVSGDIKTILSAQAIKGNARAEQFAADVTAAMEDINKIRSTFGATAFRGHDAFQAMIAQAGAGRLLQDKNVLKDVLTKSIEDMRQVRNVQAKYVGVPDLAPPPPSGGPPLIKTKSEFDALPSGTIYLEEDGKRYRKP